jgi:hypothetical protein
MTIESGRLLGTCRSGTEEPDSNRADSTALRPDYCDACHRQELPAVLLVGNVRPPDRAGAFVVDLELRQVGHEAVGGGALPVLLTGLEEDAVAGTDGINGDRMLPYRHQSNLATTSSASRATISSGYG